MGGLLVGVLAAAACGLSLVYWFQGALIFFPQALPQSVLASFSDLEYRVRNGEVELRGWLVRRPVTADRPLVVYYGGNAEDVAGNLRMLDRFPSNALLFMNYRGYGGSEGRPTEGHLFDDALHILDTVTRDLGVDTDRVVLMGRSLGSGVAVHVAGKRRIRGVILVTPFDSLVSVARRHYPILPVGLLLRHRFESDALAPDIAAPSLMLLAGRDEIIPRKSSLALAERWGGPVRTVTVEEATHNDIESFPVYWREIDRFLSSPPGRD